MSGAYYRDAHAYLEALEAHGKLVRIDRPVNKDTELHPLVRLQFLGLPEEARRAFLFTHVTDGSGRRYPFPVSAGAIAASAEICALGLRCSTDELGARLLGGQLAPVAPVVVDRGPVHEVVLTGAELERAGGVTLLPIPISTPGFDNAPYVTAGHWVSKDPESGIRNVGNYRGQVKAPLRLGCFVAQRIAGLGVHWRKAHKLGRPLEVALVLGTTPNITHAAVGRFPLDVDEFAVAGGMVGQPVELVRCVTVDVEVPANAEIVVEGVIPTDAIEPEGPFGEFTGYMARREVTLFCNVTAITYRRGAVLPVFLSEFPPSESSKIRLIGKRAVALKRLRTDRGIESVTDVGYPERGAGAWGLAVVQFRSPSREDVWDALEAVARQPAGQNCKLAVAVDEDIGVADLEAILWALSFRVDPERDVRVVPTDWMTLDLSRESGDDGPADPRGQRRMSSALLIDATRKHAYPPLSLPSRPFMERAIELWGELGLGRLSLPHVWHGYELGTWEDADRREADLAVGGGYLETGEQQRARRVRVAEDDVEG